MQTTTDREHLELSALELRQRKSGRIFLVVIGIAVFYAGAVLASFMQTYAYESSDRGWATTEEPMKGWGLPGVERSFSRYVASSGVADLVLYRTFKPAWFSWVPWIDNHSHARWDLPYREPGEHPASAPELMPLLDALRGAAEKKNE